ncbi:HAMP domain-containing sensor histidine kinase [Arthrobacter sp. AQ5-05]|uniref:sensor histidine kinase n=1 Tax=Arthrobacter sp. AQ5-05 TaxID=2184581 RepID=UPI0011BE2791|nr:HAMP domain-containing sensor histidine kinase [Arthrobacter sp. AQ5-05]
MNTRDVAELRRAAIRLSVQFTALTVVLLVVMGALLYSIVAAGTVESTTRALEDASRIDSPRDAPLGVFVSFLDNQGVVSPRVMPRGLPDNAAMARVAETGVEEREGFSAGGRTYEVLTTLHGDRVVQAAVDTHEGRESLDRLAWAMAVAIAAATVLAVAASAWMARRAMLPLSESLALQRRFVADASHELRTPLTLLSTRAQLLRRKLSGPESDLSRDAVSAEVSRLVEDSKLLTAILDDLLISTDPRENTAQTAVDLVALAANAVELAAPQASQRNIGLHMDDFDGSVTVEGSPVALQRILTSLISNALDHARTVVGVAVEIRGNDARIVVSDDGPGFAPGTEKRAFERFSSARPGSSDADATRHYGLGLALAAEIAAHHHGKILIEPAQRGRGAAVVAVLPLART